MISIDELKDRVSIEDVLVAHGGGIQLRGWGQEAPVYCPYHPNENTPAGSVNIAKGLYRCYSCGVAGSVIDLAMAWIPTTDLREAREYLEENFL